MKGVDANECMKLFEDFINSVISAPAVPPSFDNTLVVTVDGEMAACCASTVEVTDKTFKAKSLCPANILLTMECLPAWDESPGLPPSASNNCDAST
jgi:hypothetical protein